MYPPRVDQHRQQLVDVVGVGVGLWGQKLAGTVLVQVQLVIELVPVIDLDHGVLHKVVLKSLQLQLQNRREALKHHPLARILHAVPLRVVLVLPLQRLHLAVALKTLIHRGTPLDVQLDVHERLLARRLVVDVDALYVVHGLALKQLVDLPLHARALHLFLQPVAQYSVQLLDVVLLEGVAAVPAKRLGEVGGADGGAAKLELVEHPLQRQGHAGGGGLLLAGGHVVHSLSEQVDVVEGLQQGVHVAGGPLVLKAHIPRLLLAVVPQVISGGDAHIHLYGEGAILQVALLRVPQGRLGRVLGEPPVNLLWREVVSRIFPERVGGVAVVQQAELELG